MNTKKKTIKEWFETIKDEDVRERALANCSKTLLNYKTTSLNSALRSGFSWSNTPELAPYWAEQHRKAENNEL